MCWQLVVVALLLVLDRTWPAITVVALLSVVVVGLTAVRVRGRWLSEWVLSWAEYLRRNADRDLPGDHTAGRALLRVFAPEAVGVTGEVNDEPVFMISRTAGVTAVLHPSNTTRDLTKSVPAPETLLPAPDDQTPAFAVQVVHHAGLDRSRPPRVWIALQALRTVDVHRDGDVRQALGNAIRRVRRKLRRDGLPTRPLTEPETLGTLAALAHVNGGRSRVRERWHVWWSGPVSQVTFQLAGWHRLPPTTAPQLLRWLLNAAPGATVTVAVTAHRTPDDPEPSTTAALRLAAADPVVLDRAADELARLARERGVTLERLDGRHAPGVAATLPIGVPGQYSGRTV